MGEELIYFNIPSAYGLSDRVVQELLSCFDSYEETDDDYHVEIVWKVRSDIVFDFGGTPAICSYLKHFVAVGSSASENLYLVNPTAATELYGVEAKVKMDEYNDYETYKVLIRPVNASFKDYYEGGCVYTKITVVFDLLERMREK